MSETTVRQPSLKELVARRLAKHTSPLAPDLERRIRAMARRWQYSPDELADVLDRARRDPAGWERAVIADEHRAREFRQRGLLPRMDS